MPGLRDAPEELPLIATLFGDDWDTNSGVPSAFIRRKSAFLVIVTPPSLAELIGLELELYPIDGQRI